MLNSLEYSVTFPTTGRCFQNRIDFAPGLTAITGRNEAGKTLNLEMIRYCLFGKSALRGAASDYKNLSATLSLVVNSQDVRIERAKKETLWVDGAVEAVGAEAINKAVPALLGFGMDVFDIACSAQQGELDALTQMKPTERRAMIDRLVGVDLLETIEKDCRSEAKSSEAVATSLILSVNEPQEPVQPEGYEPSAVLQEKLAEAQAHEAERQRLSAIAEPQAPVEPEAPACTDVEMLEQHEADRQTALREQAHLQGQLAGIPVPSVSREQLGQAVAYAEYLDEVRRRGPKPDYSAEQLAAWARLWVQKADAERSVLCPKCSHEFNPQVEVDVAAIRALPDPPISRDQIRQQQSLGDRWTEPLAEVPEVVVENIQQEILAHARVDDRAALQLQLAELVVPADRSGELRAARAYCQARSVYDERVLRYDQGMAAFRDAQARLAELGDRSELLGRLHSLLSDARGFEAASDRYQYERRHYEDVTGRAREARELSEGFKAGALSLKNARVRVKQELAPSLARAASTLLVAMTNGERRYITIDEDFNITVDGQALQTLSGSGKSVVNLALRIGLGQVLTSRVLPIFMGDEIDKDMDQERAGATHEMLQNLRQYLTQIILVTHKEIEADNTISQDTVFA